ncbi:MAG TPA: flagellar assembly protein FliW [Candidatus Baltobacteraceae bacterium]|nr:flagellar assembly protein FliW [Candidatus Baltobacteraceae bacterium]
MEEEKITVELAKFGACTYAESDVIEFPWGLPGFPTLHRWLPLTVESHPSFVWFQSLEDHQVAIPTVDPWLLFENYEPKTPAYAFTSLEIREAADFATLCVVVVTPNAEEMTINLMAPILVNLRNHRARQIMLDNSTYSTREPIPRKAPASSKTA